MILVVNADDAGVDSARNRGVLRAARSGIVRSASVLVNFGAAKEFVEEARRLKNLSIGLHANFTEGIPLVKGHRTLAGSDGRLLGKKELMRRGAAGLLDRLEARRELEAQWQALEDLGVEPTHLDGHNHAHLLPGIAEAVLDAIPASTWVRLGARRASVEGGVGHTLPPDPFGSPPPSGGPRGGESYALLEALSGLAARAWKIGWSRFRTPALFVGPSLASGYRAKDLITLLSAIDCGDDDVVELMTHPGETCAGSVPFSSSQDRVRELETLTDPCVFSFIKTRAIRLSGFGGLR